MKDLIIKKIEPLVGKPLMYGNQVVTIKRYEFDDERERVFIHFMERGQMDRPLETVEHLISEFKPIPQQVQPPEKTSLQMPGQNAVTLPFLSDSGLLDKVTDLLLKDIEDIKSGEITLDKAEARAKNIDMIIDVEKTKIAKAAVVVKLMGK